MSQQKQVDTYYLAVCPECNKFLEYTIDAKVDYLYNIEAEGIDSKMKQAAMAAAAEHNNNIQKHSARLVEYKIVEDNHEAENEKLRKEKVAVLRGELSKHDITISKNILPVCLSTSLLKIIMKQKMNR